MTAISISAKEAAFQQRRSVFHLTHRKFLHRNGAGLVFGLKKAELTGML